MSCAIRYYTLLSSMCIEVDLWQLPRPSESLRVKAVSRRRNANVTKPLHSDGDVRSTLPWSKSMTSMAEESKGMNTCRFAAATAPRQPRQQAGMGARQWHVKCTHPALKMSSISQHRVALVSETQRRRSPSPPPPCRQIGNDLAVLCSPQSPASLPSRAAPPPCPTSS
jgi:hypothetical protein